MIMKILRPYSHTFLALLFFFGAAQPAYATHFGTLLYADQICIANGAGSFCISNPSPTPPSEDELFLAALKNIYTLHPNTLLSQALDPIFSDPLNPQIPTVTCSTYCYPYYYNHIGLIRLKLICDAQSPPIYTAQLLMNGVPTPIHTKVCPTACTSYPNACGATATGMTDSNGICSVTPPALPVGLGTTCTSRANSCGDVGYDVGYIQCNGLCSAAPVAERSYYRALCTSAPNSCGRTNMGTYNCDHVCSATTPVVPSNYGTACTLPSARTFTSLANSCRQRVTVTVTEGTYNCSGVCSGTPPPAPSDATCTPKAPVIDGLFDKNGVNLGNSTSARTAAYDPLGYQIYAHASTPDSSQLTYYFEWSTDGVNWTGDPGLPAGGWATVP